MNNLDEPIELLNSHKSLEVPVGEMNSVDRDLDINEDPVYDSHKVILDSLNYKKSRRLQFKLLVAFLCLLNVGMAEQTTGVLMRYLLDYYHVDHSIISFIFLVQFLGFFLAASINDYMHRLTGLQGTIFSAQIACLICFGVCSFRPPLAIFIIFYLLNGYSTGCQNSTFNTWGGKLEYHNQIMGLLHSAYGIGSIISPVLATHLLESNHGDWKQWYYILTMNAFILSILSYLAFRDETRWKYLYLLENGQGPIREKSSIIVVLKNKLIWLFSFVLFFYVGGEVTLGNWVFNYLIEAKAVSPRPSSIITSAYWLGMTVGRLILGFYIGAYHENEEDRILLYISVLITIFAFVFTVIPVLVIQAGSVLIIGFLIGPVFPTVAIVALKQLPLVLHVSGISFISSVGGSGGGILPFIVGLVSTLAKPGDDSGEGLVWFPLIVFVIFTTSMGFWCQYYFRTEKKNYEELD